MIIEKHLTIREAVNEKEKLENQLRLYLDKKDLTFFKTQPKGSTYDRVMVESTMTLFDRFLKYVEKNDEIDEKLFSLMASLNAYNEYIINELERISKIEPGKIKVYRLREDIDFIEKYNRKRTWEEIGELTHYSDRQVRRIYQDVVKGKI